MVKESKMTAEVGAMKEQMSKSSNKITKTISDADQNGPLPPTEETLDESHPELKDVESLLKEHDLDTDQLKDLVNNFLSEFKDLSAQKPLLTATGAFLLGFLAGRASRK